MVPGRFVLDLPENRIGILSYDFHPPVGGQGVAAYELFKRLNDTPGQEVVAVSSREADVPGHIRIKTFKHLDLGVLFFSLRVNLVLGRIIKRARLDLLHVNGGPGGVILLRRPAVPLVYYACHTYAQQERFLKRAVYRFMKLLERVGYRRADRIVAISTTTRDSLVEDYGIPAGRIDVIHCGVDCDSFRPLGLRKIPDSVLYVGRLCPRKNIPSLIKAIEQVRSELPGVKLYIVGEGEQRKMLEEMVEARGLSTSVEFTGRVSNEELVEWYNRAEVFVLPAVFEGFGLVCAEAMACGTPAVGVSGPGVIDVITDGETGILVGASFEEISAAITRLLKDSALREEMGRRAADAVRDRFNWDVIAREMAGLYRACLSAADDSNKPG